MFDFEDPWWSVSVGLLALLWMGGLVMPVRLVSPQVSAAKHFVDMEDDPEADLPPPVKPPSLVMPVVVFVLSLGLVALCMSKRVNEAEGGTRWVWMAAAAGGAGLWAVVLILLTLRLR